MQKDPANWNWKDIITELKDHYNSLIVNKLWHPANDRKNNKDNELAAMSAKIDRLEAVINKSKNNGNNSGGNSYNQNRNYNDNNHNNQSSQNQNPQNNSGSNQNNSLPW